MASKLSIIKGVSYDPIVAELPVFRYEQRILNEAVGAASYVIRKAMRHWQEGYSEDETVWDEWFVLWQHLGSEDEGVQLGLLALLYRRHELRHHIDCCCTPFGWCLPQMLGGFYQRVGELVETKPGTPDETQAIERLRSNLEKQRVALGNVPRLGKAYSGKVTTVVETPAVTIRYRQHAEKEDVAIASIETSDRKERAVSLNSLLEARAVIETSGYMSGRLRAAGASEANIRDVNALLLKLTVNVARDDYWAILSYVFEASSQSDLAARLADQKRRMIVQAASWFALHIMPLIGPFTVASLASLRFLFFFRQMLLQPDSALENEKSDWQAFFDQGAQQLGGPPIKVTLGLYKDALANFEPRIDEFSVGVQRAHLEHLTAIMRDGLDARVRQGGFWIDPLGWPGMEDPMSVGQIDLGAAFEVPAEVKTARDRLTRLSNALRSGNGPDRIRWYAEALCRVA